MSSAAVLFDPLRADIEQPLSIELQRPTLEGGDVLVASRDIVVVGLSERTNRIAVKHLARALARVPDGPRWLVGVAVPQRRAYMHLDTVITLVDRDACLVYPPVIQEDGPERAKVFEIDLRGDDLPARPCEALLPCLSRHGLDLEPIPCGGDDAVTRQREQWTDGANALALAPGVVTLYARNVHTAEALDQRGFRIVDAEDLLLGRAEVDPAEHGRVCILLPSHEISRARGGPHCLVHPLQRDPLD